MSLFLNAFRDADLPKGRHVLFLWADRFPGSKTAFDPQFIVGVGTEMKKCGRIVRADGTDDPVTEASELLRSEDARRKITESDCSLLIIGDGGPEQIYEDRCRWRVLLFDVSSWKKRNDAKNWVRREAIRSIAGADAIFNSIDELTSDNIEDGLAVFNPSIGWIEKTIRSVGRPGLSNILDLAIEAVEQYSGDDPIPRLWIINQISLKKPANILISEKSIGHRMARDRIWDQLNAITRRSIS